MKGRFIIMKQKHLTFEKRETIEDMLKNNFNLTEIGKTIGNIEPLFQKKS